MGVIQRRSLLLSVSGSGRSLEDGYNLPWFLTGQCAWPLFTQPSFSDAQLLIDSRAAHGYNGLLIALFDHVFANSAPNTAAGIAPFLTPNDFTTLNPAYLTYCLRVVRYAADRGIVCFVAPMYLGANGGIEGWESAVDAQAQAVLNACMASIAAVFRSEPNIVWVWGGDRDAGASVKTKVSGMALALRNGGCAQLYTAHGNRGTTSRGVYPGVGLNVNACYTDSAPAPVVSTGYALAPPMPQFLIEDYYANEHGMTDLGERTEGYWAWLSGCTGGQFTGENPTQGMGCNYFKVGFPDVPDRDWKVQLNSTSCNDRARIGLVARARRHWLFEPDLAHTVVTAGYSSGANLVTTARASDGSSILSYCPTGSVVTITVDRTKISGATIRGWWFNVRTGANTSIGSDVSTSGSQDFTPPDGNDWLLVLDNPSVFAAGPA